MTLQRPDKLRVITFGDGPPSEFYYNGKTMMAFAPAENLVAVADAPPTIDAALKAAFDSAAIYFPFTDLIVADPYKDIADGLELAFYIGQSNVVGGTTHRHGGVRVERRVRAGVDRRRGQAAAAGARGVPERSGAAAPRDGALELAPRPAVATEFFESAKAASAPRIAFASPKLPPAYKAPPKAKPAKSPPPKKK